MNMRKSGWFRVAVGSVALVLVFGVTACAPKEEPRDAGGLTQSEVEAMSLYEQFGLLGQRSDRLHELLAEAQLQIDDGIWSRGPRGFGPGPGMNTWPVSGMNNDNSYHISAFFKIRPEGAVGALEDLDPMIEYFESRGWEYTVEEAPLGGAFRASADTGKAST